MRVYLNRLLSDDKGAPWIAFHIAVYGACIGVVVWLVSWVHFQFYKGPLIDMSGFAAFISSIVLTVGAAETAATIAVRKALDRDGDSHG